MGRPKKIQPTEEPVEATEQALEAPVSEEKVEVEAKDEEVEAQEELEVEESTEESPAKQAFRAKVEAYKLSNPVKYERKKEYFEATLRGMK